MQQTVDKNIEKRIEQVARKTILLATKVKNPKTFEQKFKSIYGKILTYTPHTAWVQTFGKQSRLLRNSGTAFVPIPVKYGPCRPSRLSDYVDYKSARRTGPCLRFIDIKDPRAPQHPMFKEDTTTGLPIKLTIQEKSAQSQSTNKVSPTKRKATGKRTGGKPVKKIQTPRGMSLQTEIDQIPNNNSEKEDDSSSTSEETTSPSPKRQNHKNTPPATATRKSTRNRQATSATALGNLVPISTIQITSATGIKHFEINSPPEKSKQDLPSLKSMIQEMGYSEKNSRI